MEARHWWEQFEGSHAQTSFHSLFAHHPHRRSSRQHQHGAQLARGARGRVVSFTGAGVSDMRESGVCACVAPIGASEGGW